MLQIRVDENIKKAAAEIFESLGLDISTAVRIFLLRSIMEGGLPFHMKLGYDEESVTRAISTMNAISKANGNSDMTLEEINEVIRLARLERKRREIDYQAIVALERIRSTSEANGTSELTLDEINEEIRLARLERKKREAKNKEK